jgi:Na+/proline symporter
LVCGFDSSLYWCRHAIGYFIFHRSDPYGTTAFAALQVVITVVAGIFGKSTIVEAVTKSGNRGFPAQYGDPPEYHIFAIIVILIMTIFAALMMWLRFLENKEIREAQAIPM